MRDEAARMDLEWRPEDSDRLHSIGSRSAGGWGQEEEMVAVTQLILEHAS